MRGICQLSVVPIRTEPSDRSEMSTQLLFGEVYTVREKSADGKWLQITGEADQYPGWLSANQHFPVSDSYYEAYGRTAHPLALQTAQIRETPGRQWMIMPGSTLPFLENNRVRLNDAEYTFAGEAADRPADWLSVAYTYLKAPYLWGGRSLFGIDCSGFTQQVYRICGYQLPRDAYQQATQGTRVSELADARPGDLAFFANTGGRITHVGILLENKQIIHASGEVRVDDLHPQGIWRKDWQAYTHTLAFIRRLLS